MENRYYDAMTNLKEVDVLLKENIEQQQQISDNEDAVVCMCSCYTRAVRAKKLTKKALDGLKVEAIETK